MSYIIYFKIDDVALKLPINPEEIKFTYETTINKYEIIGLGEISEFSADKLVSTQINSFIPRMNTNLITNSNISANTFVNKVNEARANGEVIELIIRRDSLENINLNCYVQAFNVIEKAGEVDDVYYEATLLEWRSHNPSIIDIQQPAPIQIQVPVETTASQYIAKVNNVVTDTQKKEIRVSSEKNDKAVTTSDIVQGDIVIINGNGYNTAGGLFGLHKLFNNYKGTIDSIVTGKKYPYKVKTKASDKSEAISIAYYFEKGSLRKAGTQGRGQSVR